MISLVFLLYLVLWAIVVAAVNVAINAAVTVACPSVSLSVGGKLQESQRVIKQMPNLNENLPNSICTCERAEQRIKASVNVNIDGDRVTLIRAHSKPVDLISLRPLCRWRMYVVYVGKCVCVLCFQNYCGGDVVDGNDDDDGKACWLCKLNFCLTEVSFPFGNIHSVFFERLEERTRTSITGQTMTIVMKCETNLPHFIIFSKGRIKQQRQTQHKTQAARVDQPAKQSKQIRLTGGCLALLANSYTAAVMAIGIP